MNLRLTNALIIALTLITGCNSYNSVNSGLVASRLRYFDHQKQQYIQDDLFWPDARVYYRDSFAVEEIRYLYMEDPVHHLPRRVEAAKYLFIDLHSRRIYEYPCFSDTAKIINSYILSDTSDVAGGWNFWGCRFSLPFSNPPELMADTTINKKKFRRYLFTHFRKTDGVVYTDRRISYHDCSPNNSLFKYDKCFSEKTGCPMVRFDAFSEGPEGPFSNISASIEELHSPLTKNENRVFDAWIRNIKDPVSVNDPNVHH